MLRARAFACSRTTANGGLTLSTLYVDRKGVDIDVDVDADTLVFREEGKRVGVMPLGPLERIYLRGDVTLRARVLGRLGERGIGVVILSGRKGEATLLLPRLHNDAARRMAQFQLAQDPEARLDVARRFVERKLARQLAHLEEARERLPSSRYLLTRAAGQVASAHDAVGAASSIARLRGLEGAAAQAYFSGLQQLFAPSLGFTGRNRRPPKDPVNAVLSLAYTLLHAEAVLRLYGSGLDPFIGFLHDLDFGRESLACDFVEPLRVGADRFACELFRERTLEEDHFSRVQGACLLGKAGRVRFYETWESVVDGFRVELSEEVDALCIRIEGR